MIQLRTIVAASGLLLAATLAASACDRAAASGEAHAFPLHVESGKRFIVDTHGQPFFMHGDSAWSLIADLTREEAEIYLTDRHSRGFNTLLVNLIEHRFARNAPANAYGDRPFIGKAFGAPNEAYFRHADWVLRRACELGFVVLLAPAYLGYGGQVDGWYGEMTMSGDQKLRDYGRFVGHRYGSLRNVVWLEGGDYNPPDRTVVRAVAEGILEADPDGLQTAHGAPETAALDYWHGEKWLSLNNVYTYDPTYLAALNQHDQGGDMPYFLLESAYENEHAADAHRVRMQAYQALLSGAAGHLFGNNPIWHFGGPGLYPADMTWRQALDSPGARSMTVLRQFFSTVAWWELEPHSADDFVIAGKGGYHSRVTAALAGDRSSAQIYLPTAQGITLDLAMLAGPLVAASWFDPSSGEVQPAPGSPFSTDPHYFRPPYRGDPAASDWVLSLVSQDVGLVQ